MVKRIGILALFAMLTVAALASSLGTAFQTLPLNPDMAEMAQIYNGITQYGLRFPLTWGYTQDNQVLSLLPFAEIFYAITGVSGASVVIQGWLIFVVNAALTGLLVKVATKSWGWAWLAWLFALLASPMAIGQPAILAYPVTHNSVWAFGLLGVIGLIRYFTHRPSWSIPIVSFCIIVGTVSDPWFAAVFTVPAFILSLFSRRLFEIDKPSRKRMLKGIAYSYIIGKLLYFLGELAGMLPSDGLSFATFPQMINHVGLLAESIALYFQAYPAQSNHVLQVILVIYVTSMAVVISLGTNAAYLKNKESKILLIFSVLSSIVIASAFIFTSYADGIGSSRFIVNVFYIGILWIMITASTLWNSQKIMAQIFVAMAIGGYLFLGAANIAETGWRYLAKWGNTRTLAVFLADHHLHNGYTEYWNTDNAWSLDIFTRNAVVLHALGPNMGVLWPRVAAQSTIWNKPTNEFRPTFFIFNASEAGYKEAAMKTFGRPKQVLHFENDTIYLYDHDLSQQLALTMKNGMIRWNIKNNKNNRKSISKVCRTLDISSGWTQNAYSWLMIHGLAK
jgi:hypothetical protein